MATRTEAEHVEGDVKYQESHSSVTCAIPSMHIILIRIKEIANGNLLGALQTRWKQVALDCNLCPRVGSH